MSSIVNPFVYGSAPSPPAPSGHRYWRVRSISSYNSGEFLGLKEIEFRATSGGADQTFPGITASASVIDPSYPPANAFDNNTATFYTTLGNSPSPGGHWVSADFGSAVEVTEVAITNRSDGFPEDPRVIAIEWSDDNSTWTVEWIDCATTSWSSGQTKVFTKPASPLRIYRVRTTASPPGGVHSSWGEVSFTGFTRDSNYAAFASSQFDSPYTPPMAEDANVGTAWASKSSNGSVAWIAFVGTGTATQANLTAWNVVSVHAPTSFVIEHSDDWMNNWTTDLVVSGASAWALGETRNYAL